MFCYSYCILCLFIFYMGGSTLLFDLSAVVFQGLEQVVAEEEAAHRVLHLLYHIMWCYTIVEYIIWCLVYESVLYCNIIYTHIDIHIYIERDIYIYILHDSAVSLSSPRWSSRRAPPAPPGDDHMIITYTCTHTHMCVYIYIYRERERQREMYIV